LSGLNFEPARAKKKKRKKEKKKKQNFVTETWNPYCEWINKTDICFERHGSFLTMLILHTYFTVVGWDGVLKTHTD
jgi:hypothetical protein